MSARTNIKLSLLRMQSPNDGILLKPWMEKSGISRSEIGEYVRRGWLQRVSQGVYKFPEDTPTLYGILTSYRIQAGMTYHIGAASALELNGLSPDKAAGKPDAVIFMPMTAVLPHWMNRASFDMNLRKVSTKMLGASGIEQPIFSDRNLTVSTPERAIMECILLTPKLYGLTDVYRMMRPLASLKDFLVQLLLEECASEKVKRLFLYMAEKARHPWFDRLDLSRVSLDSKPRYFGKAEVTIPKYNISIPRELADYR